MLTCRNRLFDIKRPDNHYENATMKFNDVLTVENLQSTI